MNLVVAATLKLGLVVYAAAAGSTIAELEIFKAE
jgi:hypothetical protein